MTFLAKGKKDLRILAQEMGKVIGGDLKIVHLKTFIINSVNYEEAFTKELLFTNIKERKEK